MTRPLWQLLLLARESKQKLQLSCEECFALLECDADRFAAGADPVDIFNRIGGQNASRCRLFAKIRLF